MTLFMRRPARVSLMMFAGVCAIVLLLNIGTLAVEFNANKRLLNWLEDRLERYPDDLDKLREILGSVAIREVGDILSIPFERPRSRKEIMEDPRYYELREHLITFLNDRSHIRPSREPKFQPSPDMAAELASHGMVAAA